ncbi:MAG TPA: hypothetical protein PK867_19750, partial [Pirellulales bacterium]|nr:hypothetical protein [Pirellulales bacterium]
WSVPRIEPAGPTNRIRFALSLAACILLGAVFQFSLEIAAPNGLQRWAELYHGFRTGARIKFDDVPSVITGHATVIASMEPSHVSANPAGWVIVYRALLSFFDGHPRAAELVWKKIEPHELAWCLREMTGTRGVPAADQAAITVVAIASRLLALLAGLPIAWLVLQRSGRAAALVACAAVSFVPAAPLVAPVHDTVYMTFAALIVALSHYASERRSWPAAGAAGGLIGVGMLFSLCFVIVAMLCVLMVAFRAVGGRAPTFRSVLAAAAGWLLVLIVVAGLGNHRPWESWAVNLAKNHEFNAYSGCTYAKWIGVNPLEFAVAMGIPAVVFLAGRAAAMAGASVAAKLKPSAPGGRKGSALLAAWVATILALDLAGTNRGEICRLWLFLMPIGVAMAVEWVDTAGRGGRAVVAGFLLLQAFNCVLPARELAIYGPFLPRQIQDQYFDRTGQKWKDFRRLSEKEIQRRAALHHSATAD